MGIGQLGKLPEQSAIARQLHNNLNTTIPDFPANQFIGMLAAIGAAYGILCSLLALRFRSQA